MTLFGEIDKDSINKILQCVQTDDRTIHLHTDGGDLECALAIYDLIIGKGFTIRAIGKVASCGVIIFLGGKRRYALPHTRFMTHGVQIDMPVGSLPSDVEMEERDHYNGVMATIIKERTKLGDDEAKELLDGSHYFGTQEALRMGVIHGECKE